MNKNNYVYKSSRVSTSAGDKYWVSMLRVIMLVGLTVLAVLSVLAVVAGLTVVAVLAVFTGLTVLAVLTVSSIGRMVIKHCLRC